jgi:hypothetical protein
MVKKSRLGIVSCAAATVLRAVSAQAFNALIIGPRTAAGVQPRLTKNRNSNYLPYVKFTSSKQVSARSQGSRT